MILPGGQSLIARQFSDHKVQLALGDVVANSRLRADDWHFVVLARDGEAVRVHLDGAAEPAITTTSTAAAKGACLQFGVGLQGKLDEIAVFDRALSPTEIAAFWNASGIAEQRAQEEAERLRIAAEFAQRVKPPQFPANYAALIADMHPIVLQKLDDAPPGMRVAGPVDFSPATFATFDTAHLQGQADQLGGSYSVSVWFRCETPPDVQPVTAYFFSRGPDGDQQAPGDHLGIGGNYRREFIGRLLFFNGNQSDQAVAGSSVLAPGSWNHVVLIRDGGRVRAHLNGAEQPEIDAEIEAAAVGNTQFYLGARSDQFAPLRGQLAYFALFDRALTPAEAKQLHTASGQPVAAPACNGPGAPGAHQPTTLAGRILADTPCAPWFSRRVGCGGASGARPRGV